jgi:hypothetical protein
MEPEVLSPSSQLSLDTILTKFIPVWKLITYLLNMHFNIIHIQPYFTLDLNPVRRQLGYGNEIKNLNIFVNV